ncbi:hypothetical protein PMIN01_13368 [Paraphaeosphaeria minitans]|uniref:Uncharacterized protein n=1 Tax=Paraphaeosphaeria minitans TaxID=565426 RepID=A0A9P6G633_9PLEO|nr:hypothetical protein PMIN01_13368 [Paraphaeosphaeria minitans]
MVDLLLIIRTKNEYQPTNQPLNPARILDNQLTPTDQETPDSDTSTLSASDWRKINQLLKAVVDVGGDSQAKQLSQTVHHITIQKQLLEDENKHLREALATKKHRSKKGRPFPLDRSDSYHGGATFWSPRSVQRARDRQHQLYQDKEQKQRQKADQMEARRSNQQLKARLLHEKRVARMADRKARAQQKADAALVRRLEQQARRAQKQHQQSIKIARLAPKKPSTPRKQVIRPAQALSGGVDLDKVASLALTPSTRRGRLIRTPSRYR